MGVSQRFGDSVGYLLAGAVAAVRPENLAVVPMRRLAMLTPESAAEFNGVPAVGDEMTFIGLGALGSQLFMNLWRSGFGRWTLIDRDLHLPHNDSRHVLINGIGEFKANAMANFAAAIFPEHASVAVGRHIAHSYGGHRRISAFLNPSAKDLILLVEPADRSIRLDQLEMMYYRAVIQDRRLEGHLIRGDAPVRYSNACRDLSTVISQDHIAVHAGIGSRAIRIALTSPYAMIPIWRGDDNGAVARIDVPIARPAGYTANGWKVLLDSEVQETVASYRLTHLPNETGGVLLGSFDMTRKVVLISLPLSSPEDSKEWPTVYIRGSAGLRSGWAGVCG